MVADPVRNIAHLMELKADSFYATGGPPRRAEVGDVN